MEFLPITVPGFSTLLQPTSTLSPSMASHFLQTRFNPDPFPLHRHQSFVALYIGSDGTGSHVRFKAKHAVAHIIVVRHLHLVKENHILQLRGIPHHRAFAHNGAAADKGTMADLSLFIHDQGPFRQAVGATFAFLAIQMYSPLSS